MGPRLPTGSGNVTTCSTPGRGGLDHLGPMPSRSSIASERPADRPRSRSRALASPMRGDARRAAARRPLRSAAVLRSTPEAREGSRRAARTLGLFADRAQTLQPPYSSGPTPERSPGSGCISRRRAQRRRVLAQALWPGSCRLPCLGRLQRGCVGQSRIGRRAGGCRIVLCPGRSLLRRPRRRFRRARRPRPSVSNGSTGAAASQAGSTGFSYSGGGPVGRRWLPGSRHQQERAQRQQPGRFHSATPEPCGGASVGGAAGLPRSGAGHRRVPARAVTAGRRAPARYRARAALRAERAGRSWRQPGARGAGRHRDPARAVAASTEAAQATATTMQSARFISSAPRRRRAASARGRSAARSRAPAARACRRPCTRSG